MKKTKKKVDYKQKYYDHFGLSHDDFVYDEYQYIVNGLQVKAHKIHHVLFGAHKTDDIENLMAVSDNGSEDSTHFKAHDEQLDRYYLKEIHLKFLENNPY